MLTIGVIHMNEEKQNQNQFSVPAERLRVGNFVSEQQLTEAVEALSKARYDEIQNLPDTIKATGKSWYVSGTGRENASGDSPEDPFCSLDELEANRSRIKAGDAVFFNRGEEFRGCCITSVSGVSYGAYGKGSKPIINSSLRNHITDNWQHIGDDIWTSDGVYPADVGNIIFNHGEAVGFKKIHREQISEYLDYWSDHDDGNRIYIKLKEDPRKTYSSIEIAFNIWMLRLEQNSDITVENLAFRYGGGHGIRGSSCHNITVRGCDFRFIGGSFLTEFRDGTVRCGNCVEFMCGCTDILVEACCADEVYDSGITHQGLGLYCAENIVFRDNLIMRCGMGGIEYWLGQGSLAKNVTYENNIMRFSGECFGGIQRPDQNATAHIQGNGYLYNRIESFVIRNNVFDRGRYDLVNSQSREDTLPKLDGNVYIQRSGQRFGSWGSLTDKLASEGEQLLNEWQDPTGRVFVLNNK